jgi:hypothetical protein
MAIWPAADPVVEVDLADQAVTSGAVSPMWRVMRRLLWKVPVIPAARGPACHSCQALSRAAGSASDRYQPGVPGGRCKRLAVMPS